MIISKDRLFNIKDKIKVYREGGIDGKFVITEDEIDWLINEVEALRNNEDTYQRAIDNLSPEILRLNQEIEKLRKERDKLIDKNTSIKQLLEIEISRVSECNKVIKKLEAELKALKDSNH